MVGAEPARTRLMLYKSWPAQHNSHVSKAVNDKPRTHGSHNQLDRIIPHMHIQLALLELSQNG